MKMKIDTKKTKRGRPKQYATQAERQAAYVTRHDKDEARRLREYRACQTKQQKANSIERLQDYKKNNPDWKPLQSTIERRYTKQKKQRKDKRMSKVFIAFDGEGINTDQIQTYLRSDGDLNGMPVYKQKYVIITASDGRTIENWKDGLKTEECLDFLLSYAGEYYLVGFGIGYDVTKMLCGELNENDLRRLWKTKKLKWRDYWITYTPNKIFQVSKNGKGITLYDTRAFFQKSFVKACQDWKIDVPDYIIAGKEARNVFKEKDKAQIRKYNLKECVMLVELMNKMRDAMNTVNIVPYQWYGVGAMAQVVMQDNYIKQHIATPIKMVPLFLEAYYGGRNQTLKLGEFAGDVYLHDINSAYPDAMVDLPSSIGSWFETKPQYYDYPYTLYQVEWKLPPRTLITPFPVRKKGNIYYPLRGAGTYWQDEIQAAMKYYAKYITIKKVWYFQPDDEVVRPFGFYKDYYAQRQKFIANGNDAQLVLKLALNAGYGKVAQSIGGKVIIDPITQEITYSLPAFQNYFWAGKITSRCRAKVFELAMIDPKSVIAFATDGVTATRQLCEHSAEKQLGCWEVKSVQKYFIAQTGVYTYQDGDVDKFRSRGFDYKTINYDDLRRQWRISGVYTVFYYTENRFIGIGVGLQRNHFDLIGCWIDVERKISFIPQSMRLHKDCDATIAGGINNVLQLQPPVDMGMSEPYKMKQNWLATPEAIAEQDDLDQIT